MWKITQFHFIVINIYKSIAIPVGIQISMDLRHFSEDLWKCGLRSHSTTGGPSAEMRMKSFNEYTARLTRKLLLIRILEMELTGI